LRIDSRRTSLDEDLLRRSCFVLIGNKLGKINGWEVVRIEGVEINALYESV